MFKVISRKSLVALAVAAAVLAVAPVGCAPTNRFEPPPPPEVTVSPPLRKSLTTYKQYTGTTRAVEQVDLRARVRGFLKEVKFKEADDVEVGQLLLVIDEEPFKVRVDEASSKVDEARAALAKAETSKAREVAKAQLGVDQAALELARVEERRNRSLLARNAASREDVDRAEAARKRAEAQVEADQASIEQANADYLNDIAAAKARLADAEAALASARIDLGYCRISAPIKGRITRKLVDVGNLVGDGSATILATIVNANPIHAYTTVSDTDALMFRRMRREGRRGDFRKETVPIEMGLPDEKGFPHVGRIDYADPGADPGTGTLQARAVFDNPDLVMIPGLFARLRVPVETEVDSLLVPDRAVLTDQSGKYVLVVAGEDTVEARPVTTGPLSDEGLRVIQGGLRPEDSVIVNGLQKARPGARVRPIAGSIAPAQQAAREEPPPAKAAPAEKSAADSR